MSHWSNYSGKVICHKHADNPNYISRPVISKLINSTIYNDSGLLDWDLVLAVVTLSTGFSGVEKEAYNKKRAFCSSSLMRQVRDYVVLWTFFFFFFRYPTAIQEKPCVI